jgi:pimeloyl-ACP methyl ester carboxylesterase
MKRLLCGITLLLSLTAGQTALAQSVRVIEWSRGHSPIAVLFLHGLGGCAVPSGSTAKKACAEGAEDSFRNPSASKSWPEMIATDDYRIASNALAEILPKPLRIEDLGVWGVDYSRLTTSGCATFSVPEAARLVRAQVEASKLFERYEQVIIVAHSMGGLIAKNMLLAWQNSNDPDGMLARTIGVLLLGVPSQGSDIAPPPGMMRYVLETLGVNRLANACSRQVKDLFAGDENTYLRDLERRWEQLLNARRAASRSQAPLIYCAYETMPEPILTKYVTATIVKQIYAQTQCSDEQFAIPTYHTMLPKPSTPEDQRMTFTGRGSRGASTIYSVSGHSGASAGTISSRRTPSRPSHYTSTGSNALSSSTFRKSVPSSRLWENSKAPTIS